MLRDPITGELTDEGRRHFHSNDGANLRDAVADFANASPEDKRRWVVCMRRFANLSETPPLVNERKQPTRFAMLFEGWGERAPRTGQELKVIGQKAAERGSEIGLTYNTMLSEATKFAHEAEEIEAFLDDSIEPVVLAELFIADSKTVMLEGEAGEDGEEKPKLFRKTILRTGTWNIRPSAQGPIRKPLKVFRDEAPKGHISMAQLVENFKAGLIEHVTVPLSHADKTDENTGYVRNLEIVDTDAKKGQAELVADIEFTEPDIEGKVERGTIPNVSSGILFDWDHKETGKRIGQIIAHVCLTSKPWINKLPAFGAATLEDVVNEEFAFEFADERTESVKPKDDDPQLADDDKKKPSTGSVVWKAEEGTGWIRARISQQLREMRDNARRTRFCSEDSIPWYTVEDVSSGKALISAGYGADQQAWIALYDIKDSELTLAPVDEWTSARQEWVAAAQENNQTRKPAERAPSRTHLSSLSPLELAQQARRKRLGGHDRPREQKEGGPTVKFTLEDLRKRGVDLSQFSETEITEMEAQEQEDVKLREENDRLKAERRDEIVSDRVEKLGAMFEDFPGVAKYLADGYRSDDGEPAVELFEFDDKGERKVGDGKGTTLSQFIDGLVEVMPKDEKGEKIVLGEQLVKPPVDDPKPPDQRPSGDSTDPREKYPDKGAKARAYANAVEMGLDDATVKRLKTESEAEAEAEAALLSQNGGSA